MSALTLRLLGSGLLALAGALLGYEKKAEVRTRRQSLLTLCSALGRMESELLSLQTPLPQLLAKLEDCPFFLLVSAGFGGEPLEQLWRRAAEAQPLAREDIQTLAALGAVVGRYDAARQAGELALVRRRLSDSAGALERDIDRRARHYSGLGAALGAMLAAILF